MRKKILLFFGFLILVLFGFFLFLVNVNALEYSVDYTRNDTKQHKINDYLTNESLEIITNDIINNQLPNGLEYDNYALFVNSDSYETNFIFSLIQWDGDLFGVSSQNGSGQPYRFSIMPSLNNGFRGEYSYDLTNNTLSYKSTELYFTELTEDFTVVSKNNNNVNFNILVSFNTNTNIKFIKKLWNGYGMTWQEDIKISSNSTYPYFDSTIGSWGSATIPLNTFQVSDLFYNGFLPSITTIDMSSANGILFYYKNWQETPPDTYTFTLNGSYEYTQFDITNSSLLLSDFDFIPTRNKKVPLENVVNFEIDHCWSCMDNVYVDNKNYQYGFYFKNLTINEIQTISYNSNVFDYRFVDTNGAVSLPITFIDSEGNSNSIETLPPIFINNNSITSYFTYYTNFLNSIKLKSNVIWSYFSNFFNNLPTELNLVIMFSFVFALFLILYRAFRD